MTDAELAMQNVAFLEKHPEYKDTYTSGVLSRRVGGGHYEHFRYFDPAGVAERRDPPDLMEMFCRHVQQKGMDDTMAKILQFLQTRIPGLRAIDLRGADIEPTDDEKAAAFVQSRAKELRALRAIDRRGTGAEPTAGLTEIAEEFIATHFASTMPFRVWAERFAGALRGGGPAPEYDVLAMVVPYVKHDTNCTARTGDGLCICGMQTAMERLQRALSSGGPAREEPLADVRQMLKRLLEQTEEDLRGRVRGDPMYDYHSGAKVTLLAVLNYEPLRRALSSGLPAPEEAHG